tara:strand:+ start:175 stop:927 length:753 start_codon:yes stop_codon:yes gene_type:complete
MSIQGQRKLPNVNPQASMYGVPLTTQEITQANLANLPAQPTQPSALALWAQPNQRPSLKKFSNKSYYDRIGYTSPEKLQEQRFIENQARNLAPGFKNFKNPRGNFFDLEDLEPADIFSQKYNQDNMGSLARALEIQKRNRGMKLPEGVDPLKDSPPPEKGFLEGLGSWASGHPLEAAKVGLGIWQGIQTNRSLDQQDDYLKDVRQAMAFDQADVDRRWNLAMGDYRVREEDQNQYRTAQGMTNTKTNFTV